MLAEVETGAEKETGQIFGGIEGGLEDGEGHIGGFHLARAKNSRQLDLKVRKYKLRFSTRLLLIVSGS